MLGYLQRIWQDVVGTRLLGSRDRFRAIKWQSWQHKRSLGCHVHRCSSAFVCLLTTMLSFVVFQACPVSFSFKLGAFSAFSCLHWHASACCRNKTLWAAGTGYGHSGGSKSKASLQGPESLKPSSFRLEAFRTFSCQACLMPMQACRCMLQEQDVLGSRDRLWTRRWQGGQHKRGLGCKVQRGCSGGAGCRAAAAAGRYRQRLWHRTGVPRAGAADPAARSWSQRSKHFQRCAPFFHLELLGGSPIVKVT